INADGSMTWETALNWVAALNRHAYLGHTDWTLPVTPETDPNGTLKNNTTGFSFGFNCTSSEMGELFYTEFGGKECDTVSSLSNENVNMFTNLQPYYYWSATTRSLPADFSFGNGFLGTDVDIDFEYALPGYPAVYQKPTKAPANPPDDWITSDTLAPPSLT